MKTKIGIIASLSVAVVCCMSLTKLSDAYDEPTHEAIALRAVEVSSLRSYLSSHLGFAKGLQEVILNRTAENFKIDVALSVQVRFSDAE
jgi:hypothetical protein